MLEKVIKLIRPEWIFWEDYVIEDNSDWLWPVIRYLKEFDNIPTEEEIQTAISEIEFDEEKQSMIQKYRDIEKEAISKRSEYITAELLPEWTFKNLKLSKLETERINIEIQYNDIMNNLISKYWETILNDLL